MKRMKRISPRPPILALAALAVLAALALASSAQADKTPACVHWWPQTVAMGIGYNHVVGIDNTCERAAVCTISTNIAPDPIQATVGSKERVELTTFRGSPSRVFQARVDCALQ
jgi:hypothetical protein